jgi:GNAT superfamily N-acetyltransferase
MDAFALRPARDSDVPALAALWYDGWRDAHVGRVPEELLAHRTPAALTNRMREFVASSEPKVLSITVADLDGCPIGFVVTHLDEIDQLYVRADARGTGAASTLLAHGEDRIRSSGYPAAWLAVVEGNARARHFYERQGWHDAGPYDISVWSTEQNVRIGVPVRRYEIQIGV